MILLLVVVASLLFAVSYNFLCSASWGRGRRLMLCHCARPSELGRECAQCLSTGT